MYFILFYFWNAILALSASFPRIEISFFYKEPDVVTHHWFVPESLVASLNTFHLLMKSLAMFIGYTTKIWWEEIQMRVEEMDLQRYVNAYIETIKE